MHYWTWKEIREKIESDFDLQEEPGFLSDGELMGYVNDAIDVCEAHFIKLGDYFLSVESIPLVPGTKEYSLPDSIYATKIRKLIANGLYEVRPIRRLLDVTALDRAGKNIDHKYLLINNPGSRPKIRLFPTPVESGELELYFTRNANRLTVDGGEDQEVDVPEAMLYIMAYVKMRIYEKEKSPLYQVYHAELEKLESLMIDALSQRIDDENNEIIPETGVYDDHT